MAEIFLLLLKLVLHEVDVVLVSLILHLLNLIRIFEFLRSSFNVIGILVLLMTSFQQ